MLRCVTEEIKLDLASSSRKPNELTVKTSTLGFHDLRMGSMLGIMSGGSFLDDKYSERRRERFKGEVPSLCARQMLSKKGWPLSPRCNSSSCGIEWKFSVFSSRPPQYFLSATPNAQFSKMRTASQDVQWHWTIHKRQFYECWEQVKHGCSKKRELHFILKSDTPFQRQASEMAQLFQNPDRVWTGSAKHQVEMPNAICYRRVGLQ